MEQTTPRQIKILNAETARKIAAGEVIDRPNAIVRELLDNAVDSGASQIDVEIEGGGIEKIRVADNGCGMTKENLLMAARPHATSKISTETDLLNLTTLGFRGEALASIAAVSRLTIQSGECKMRCSVTKDHIIEPSSPVNGTIVTSESLFENFPARRQFLKRPSSETKMCRSTFIEKAMARPDISFRLTVDGVIRNDLPACTIKETSLRDRFVAALEIQQSKDLFYQIKGRSSDDSWDFNLIIGDPNVARPDRKDIYIYVNGRRIQEYSLMQAIEYGAQGCFPNGTHPVSALFVTMRPDLVDFNIHPAKREARFKDLGSLHHGVSSTLHDFFGAWTKKEMKASIYESQNAPERNLGLIESLARESSLFEGEKKYNSSNFGDSGKWSESPYGYKAAFKAPTSSYSSPYLSRINERPALNEVADSAKSCGASYESPKAQEEAFRYIGTALGTFIIVEKDSALYIIDQHAAHERFLFDKIMEGQGNLVQPLLVPEDFELESEEEDLYMEKISSELKKFGFVAERLSKFKWRWTQFNSMWRGNGRELCRLIFEAQVEPKEIVRKVSAMTACKAAVKDGYVLDDNAAMDIAKKAFSLPDPHCPHGRPCWTVISREHLFSLVKRT